MPGLVEKIQVFLPGYVRNPLSAEVKIVRAKPGHKVIFTEFSKPFIITKGHVVKSKQVHG
ncbi:MAG: hypothetical protein DRN37_11580 [Thermoplasmata archaeon]|nr:MAG: hypothetical protein DRN37_11580 [Thermoplasmata archaeon]